jgi:hypothetical protein
MSNEPGKYCYSNDGERYYGNYETIEEMVADIGSEPCPSYFATNKKISWFIDPGAIQEALMERCYDEVGECAENEYPSWTIIERHIAAMLAELPPPTCCAVEELSEEQTREIKKRWK